jgi:hypothetical protein
MSSMFGYTATILIIVVLGSLAYYTSCWPLGIFIAGGLRISWSCRPSCGSCVQLQAACSTVTDGM